MLQVVLLSVALAADAAAVSVGIAAATRSRVVVVQAALIFGLFQAGMAGLGALGGAGLSGVLGAWLETVAFAVLVALGVRMIRGADEAQVPATMGWVALASLGLATSVDALAAGVSLPVFAVPLAVSLGTIGGVTALLALLAGLLGSGLGERFGTVAQRVAGVVLLVLGVGSLLSLWAGPVSGAPPPPTTPHAPL